MRTLTSFNPSSASSGSFDSGGNDGTLVLLNDSPYMLQFRFIDGQWRSVPAGNCRAFVITRDTKLVDWQIQLTPENAGSSPFYICIAEFYSQGELTAEQFPTALNRLVNIGNSITVGNATFLTNTTDTGLGIVVDAMVSDGGTDLVPLQPTTGIIGPAASIELEFITSTTPPAVVHGPHTIADGLLATSGGSVMPCATVVTGTGAGTFNHGLDRAPSIVLVVPFSASNGSTPVTNSYTSTSFAVSWPAPPGGVSYTGGWRALCIGL